MNKRKILVWASGVQLAAGLLSAAAFAQGQTTGEAKPEEKKARVGVTNLAVRPSAGAVFFNGNQKFTGGLLVDLNVLSTPMVKVGPATGALFSNLTGSAFFDGVTSGNSNYIIQIPANLKITAVPDPARKLQLGVHGGANIIRSTGTVVSGNGAAFGLGAGGTTSVAANPGGTSSSWDAHGNVGADVGYALGTNVDLSLRPDWTFLSNFTMTTATLGLALKI